MNSRRTGFLARTPVMIGAVIIFGGVAGLGVLSRHGDAELEQPGASISLIHPACHYCGIVEQVRRVTVSAPHYDVSTVATGRDEAILMLLSALSGATVSSAQAKVYEVSVRMDDGSIRAVRDGRMPQWKPGERVKVVKDQVKPLF